MTTNEIAQSTGQEFTYGDFTIRTVMIGGEPWFVAADVCAVLEIAKTYDAVGALDDDEKQQVSRGAASSVGGTNIPKDDNSLWGDTQWVVSEPGLYSLILRSRKPEAKQFKRHVTHEILPSIRKTGAYRREMTRLELIKMMLEAEENRIATEQRLALETERVDELTDHLALIGPDAGAWQALATSKEDWLVEEVARILNSDSAIAADGGIGGRRLWDWLFSENVMTRARKRPMPRTEYINRGYFNVIVVTYPDPNGGPTPKPTHQVRVTFKGIAWLHKKLGGVDPVQDLIAVSDED